ncbi:hypothetical protein M427DRAFT_156447 [Gonapodya prolifera JEL478]|uniref:Uncharacterized protein n=1 Tax=Gonapodya prolifera (strain JEL478) TaxID=1344416 RepID=A0A139ABE7_GONPJ|nr:hypothetical protein M427DRAFT_156447 [Gonapodya prolifera JEL478]|eukprot:KXS13733.1 hypothetical protein M427DRAFT_156447 [Gonapodya prolifera JEL478]
MRRRLWLRLLLLLLLLLLVLLPLLVLPLLLLVLLLRVFRGGLLLRFLPSSHSPTHNLADPAPTHTHSSYASLPLPVHPTLTPAPAPQRMSWARSTQDQHQAWRSSRVGRRPRFYTSRLGRGAPKNQYSTQRGKTRGGAGIIRTRRPAGRLEFGFLELYMDDFRPSFLVLLLSEPCCVPGTITRPLFLLRPTSTPTPTPVRPTRQRRVPDIARVTTTTTTTAPSPWLSWLLLVPARVCVLVVHPA